MTIEQINQKLIEIRNIPANNLKNLEKFFNHERYDYENYCLLQDALARYLHFLINNVVCFAVYFDLTNENKAIPKKKIQHIYLSYNLNFGCKDKFDEEIKEKVLVFFKTFLSNDNIDIYESIIYKPFTERISKKFFDKINDALKKLKKLKNPSDAEREEISALESIKTEFQAQTRTITDKNNSILSKRDFFKNFFYECNDNSVLKKNKDLYYDFMFIYFLYCDFHHLRLYFKKCYDFECFDFENFDNNLTIISERNDDGIFHCETQLAVYLHEKKLINMYIGIAKLSCPVCKYILDCYEFNYRGSHNCLKTSLQSGKWYFPISNNVNMNGNEDIYKCFLGWLEKVKNNIINGENVNTHQCKGGKNDFKIDGNVNFGKYCYNISDDIKNFKPNTENTDDDMLNYLKLIYIIYNGVDKNNF